MASASSDKRFSVPDSLRSELPDTAEHIPDGTDRERRTPRLAIDLGGEDRVEVRLVQEMPVDGQMLRPVRAERRRLPVAPRSDVNQEIDAGLGREVLFAGRVPRRNRLRP